MRSFCMEKRLKLTHLNKQEMKSAVGGQQVEYMVDEIAGGGGGGCNCWWCLSDTKRRWVNKSSKRFR